MANKFRKGDKVTITVGKDKGKSGTITQVFPAEHKIIVEGVNKVKSMLSLRSKSLRAVLLRRSYRLTGQKPPMSVKMESHSK